ncbi:hypothetical protein [Allorhodopirellula heiligendammensis]|uniref:hypothetical protein n=1 Tax=Allorhodopirellula heiligendammensis TaxID=2714739 RepID=UPI00265D6DA1|nr:hypothetical protein [Allorhodopirellula heiligendammensis]
MGLTAEKTLRKLTAARLERLATAEESPGGERMDDIGRRRSTKANTEEKRVPAINAHSVKGTPADLGGQQRERVGTQFQAAPGVLG